MGFREAISTTCPLCGGNQAKVVFDEKEMVIYRCCDCSMMYQDSEAMEGLIKKYNDDQIKQYFSMPSLTRLIAKKSFKRIKKLFNNNVNQIRVLEIGTGSGALASLLVEENVKYKGVESEKYLYNEAMKNYPVLEENVFFCKWEDADLEEDGFDVIVMIDTLEHIPYPLEVLKSLKKYLKNDGYLYVEVPNETMFGAKGFLRKIMNVYSGFPTQVGHVNLFTKKTLKGALDRASLEDVKVSQISILGDYDRMRVVFGSKSGVILKFICKMIEITRIDMLFQQGNLVATTRKQQ